GLECCDAFNGDIDKCEKRIFLNAWLIEVEFRKCKSAAFSLIRRLKLLKHFVFPFHRKRAIDSPIHNRLEVAEPEIDRLQLQPCFVDLRAYKLSSFPGINISRSNLISQ